MEIKKEQQLLDAAIAGDYQTTKQLLAEGANPNEPVLKEAIGWGYIETYYPLIQAIDNGHIAVVQLLVEAGADVNVATKGDGKTPLHAAFSGIKHVVKIGDLNVHSNKADCELIRYLVEHGANVNAKGGWCLTPLLLAIYYKEPEMVEYLIAKGADVNLELFWVDENESRTTALGAAVQENSSKMVQLLLQHGASPIDCTIREALEVGNQEIILAVITRLLQREAHAHIINNSFDTALLSAAEYGRLEIVNLLLKNSANVDAKGFGGHTVLMYAAESGHTDIVKLLLHYGADIHLKNDWQNETARMLAVKNGHKDIVAFLLKYEADMSVKDIKGQTELMYAAENGYSDIVALLLKNGSSVDAQNNDNGNRALMSAVEKGNVEIVNLLLKNGASVHTTDIAGDTVLMYAASKGNREIVELLLEYGADVHARNRQGYAACFYAAQYGNEDIVTLLLEKIYKN